MPAGRGCFVPLRKELRRGRLVAIGTSAWDGDAGLATEMAGWLSCSRFCRDGVLLVPVLGDEAGQGVREKVVAGSSILAWSRKRTSRTRGGPVPDSVGSDMPKL